MPKASTKKVQELARRLGKGERTIWRWIYEGLDIESERSIRAFTEGKELRKSNVQRGRERRAALNGSNGSDDKSPHTLDRLLSGDLPAPGRRGAAAALQRLEEAEERAHARLLLAMDHGTPFEVQELQDFWLKCSGPSGGSTLPLRLPVATQRSRSPSVRRKRFRSSSVVLS